LRHRKGLYRKVTESKHEKKENIYPKPSSVHPGGLKGVVTCPWRRPDVAALQFKDMINFGETATPAMKDRYNGIVQTVCSDAGSFMDGFYGKKKDDKGGENRRLSAHGEFKGLCPSRRVFSALIQSCFLCGEYRSRTPAYASARNSFMDFGRARMTLFQFPFPHVWRISESNR
jgi:hypothetical protein